METRSVLIIVAMLNISLVSVCLATMITAWVILVVHVQQFDYGPACTALRDLCRMLAKRGVSFLAKTSSIWFALRTYPGEKVTPLHPRHRKLVMHLGIIVKMGVLRQICPG